LRPLAKKKNISTFTPAKKRLTAWHTVTQQACSSPFSLMPTQPTGWVHPLGVNGGVWWVKMACSCPFCGDALSLSPHIAQSASKCGYSHSVMRFHSHTQPQNPCFAQSNRPKTPKNALLRAYQDIYRYILSRFAHQLKDTFTQPAGALQ